MAVEWTAERLGTHALNNQQPGPYRREFGDIADQPASQPPPSDVNIPKTPANMFLHEDPMHIVMNMWALWVVRPAEILYGTGKFSFIYLVAGIAGSLTSLY